MPPVRIARFDRGELRKPQPRGDGSVMYEGRFTRPGIFPYMRADGTIRHELRRREDILNPAFVEALMGFPAGWTELPSQQTTLFGASASPPSATPSSRNARR